jgi:hypothetical protein
LQKGRFAPDYGFLGRGVGRVFEFDTSIVLQHSVFLIMAYFKISLWIEAVEILDMLQMQTAT